MFFFIAQLEIWVGYDSAYTNHIRRCWGLIPQISKTPPTPTDCPTNWCMFSPIFAKQGIRYVSTLWQKWWLENTEVTHMQEVDQKKLEDLHFVFFSRNCCCSQWKTTEICVQNASKTWSDFCFKAAFLDPLHFRPTHLPHAAVARSILTTIYLVCWWCFSFVSRRKNIKTNQNESDPNTGSNQTHLGFFPK